MNAVKFPRPKSVRVGNRDLITVRQGTGIRRERQPDPIHKISAELGCVGAARGQWLEEQVFL